MPGWESLESGKKPIHRSQLLVRLCTHLGFQINHQKSELFPTQVFNFVGMNFNLSLGTVFITEKNLAQIVVAAGSLSKVSQAPA